jgi:parvulin-like peptidyl-prolyl isomerase
MSSSIPLVLALLSASSVSAVVPQNKPDRTTDKSHDQNRVVVVAKVGQIEISRKALLAETNRLIPLSYFHGKVARAKLAEFEEKALANLIEKALLYQDARARKIVASEEEQRAEMQAAIEKTKPGAEKLDVAQLDSMVQKYRHLLVKRILIEKNESRFAAAIPEVSDRMVRDYFGANHHQFLAPREAHLRHILIKVSPTASDREIQASKRRIDQGRRDILAGTSFAVVAKKISQDDYAAKGGDLGWVREGSFLRGAVGRAAFALEDTKLSAVIDTIQGFHLVQRVATKPRKRLTEAEVHDDLRVILQKRGKATARAKWLADLRKRFPVVTHPENRPIALPAGKKAPVSRPTVKDRR